MITEGRRLASVCALIVGLAAAPAAQAALVTHDSVGDFATIVIEQGLRTLPGSTTLGAVSAARSNIANVFDGSNATMFSTGLGGTGAGGSVSFLIGAPENRIVSASITELTFAGTTHRERARVYLGNDLGNWVFVGLLLNEVLGATATEAGGTPQVASIATLDGDGPTTYTITVLNGDFNAIRIGDDSPIQRDNRDGFDITSFSVISAVRSIVAIPEPAALGLLAAGLVGLAAVRRQRRAA